MDAVGSFFGGQMLHYAGEAGELEAKLKIALADLKESQAEAAARRELHRTLSVALEEIAPNHPLSQTEKRKEILKLAWEKALAVGR